MAVGLGSPSGGGAYYVFAERFLHGVWSLVPVSLPGPNPDFEAVSCPTAKWCLALANTYSSSGKPRSQRFVVFDDAKVLVKAMPGGSGLRLADVDCAAPWACVAVGGASDSRMVAERLTGTKWAVMRTPASFRFESGVSCATERSCVAVGSVTARLTGSVWSRVRQAPPGLSTLGGPGQAAIAWAQKYLNRRYDFEECLVFVQSAYSSAGVNIGRAATAADYWSINPMGYAKHPGDANPPVGALVFWGADDVDGYSNPAGHVGIYVGAVPGHGSDEVISTWSWPEPSSQPDVHYFSLSGRKDAGYPYLGWMDPAS